MKNKLLSIVIILSFLVIACLPSVSLVEQEVDKSPDTEIKILAFRGIS